MATSVVPAIKTPSGFDALDVFPPPAFMTRVLQDLCGAVVSFMCTIGDRLGLFRALAEAGPVTASEFALKSGIADPYAREWLSALTSAGYLAYEPETKRFRLPQEHQPFLVQEGGPMFLGGAFQQLPGLIGPLDLVSDAFASGAGVPFDAYGADLWAGMERLSATWYEHLLVPVWIASIPDLQEKLEQGAVAADVGCGRGRAVIALARAFPRSHFTGFDVFPPSIERAGALAATAGVSDRVQFEVRDGADGLPHQYDMITIFDVLHDASDPVRLLQSIRRSLVSGGRLLVLESNCSDALEENAGPAGTILFGTSVLFCTPTTIAAGGEALGTMGVPESKLRALCSAAGFSAVRRLPMENPFTVMYEVRP